MQDRPHLQQLCEDLATGGEDDRREAWEGLTQLGGLWHGCRGALSDPAAALPVLNKCFVQLRSPDTLAYLEPLHPAGEAARLRGAAARLVAAAALACGVRLARTRGV